MSTIEKLKACSSLDDFANFLACPSRHLAYVLYRLSDGEKYSTFEIPKKSGGVREISAPHGPLKTLQRRLAAHLYKICAEIEEGKDKQKPLSHGFRRGHSIFSNARPHKGRRYVLNIDLKDFFPSLNFGRVRGFFIKNRDFELNEKVATLIAQLAIHENSLPQGSPCSPIISDLLAHPLDVRMAQLARRNQCTYTRYADDLTFSTGQKVFPPALAAQQSEQSGVWVLGASLLQEITRMGFVVNDRKTRLQCRTGRQLVTGLTVNRKVNVRKEYYKTARAMCLSLFATGAYYQPENAELFKSAEAGGDSSGVSIQKLQKIEGILNHIFYIKNKADPRSDLEKKKLPTGTKKLYKRLLFFKHFVNLDKPLILCEGKTDNTYLKSAIRFLPDYRPRFTHQEGDNLTFDVRFFNHGSLANQILQIHGGTGDLSSFFIDFKVQLAKFRHLPLKHPVIVFIDNDSGSKAIFNIVKQQYNTDISINSLAQFYHLWKNLYLVKTPQIAPESCIESFFDKALLETKLDGKSFNLRKAHDAEGEFGKVVFAERIVRPNANQATFANFPPLLDCISAAIGDYKNKTGTQPS